MISYFEDLDDEVYKLEVEVKKLGWYFDSIHDLVDLYGTFSEEVYKANFLLVNEAHVKEFIEWVKAKDCLTIHYIYSK